MRDEGSGGSLSGIVVIFARAIDLPANLASLTCTKNTAEEEQLHVDSTPGKKQIKRVYSSHPSLATAAKVSATSGTQFKSLPQDTLPPVLPDAMI